MFSRLLGNLLKLAMSKLWTLCTFIALEFVSAAVLKHVNSSTADVLQLLEMLDEKNGIIYPPCSLAIMHVSDSNEFSIQRACLDAWPIGRPLGWKIPLDYSTFQFTFLADYLNRKSLRAKHVKDVFSQQQWCRPQEIEMAEKYELPTVINGIVIHCMNISQSKNQVNIAYQDYMTPNVSTLTHTITIGEITSPKDGALFQNVTMLKFILRNRMKENMDRIYMAHSPTTGIFYIDKVGRSIFEEAQETGYRVVLCEHEEVKKVCEKFESRNLLGKTYRICTSCKFNLKGRNCQLGSNECSEQMYEQEVSYRYLDCDANSTIASASSIQNVTIVHGNHRCNNSAICIDTFMSYKCICNEGWSGDFCDIDVDECESRQDNCSKHTAYCQNTPGSFNCVCNPGYTGKYCEHGSDKQEEKRCNTTSSCSNHEGTYKFNCTPGFTGQNCSEDMDECLHNPCINGGTCLNSHGSYSCECMAGFSGQHCSIDLGKCNEHSCMNGSSCLNMKSGYRCICAPGFTGQNCSENITTSFNQIHRSRLELTECPSFPCMNNGTCLDNNGSYSCVCESRFTGKNCSQKSDGCSGFPCKQNATCFNKYGKYPCICDPESEGKTCHETIDRCADFPCSNNGTCTVINGSYQCECTPGYTGSNCTVDIDECHSVPCKNGGTCHNKEAAYECSCIPGFTGKNCGIDIDECASMPCKNGGTCHNKEADYECTCALGFTGKNCDIDVNDCQHTHCQNNGTRVHSKGGFKCECVAGYTGKNCNEDINECESFPCKNGGTCLNNEGSYECTCSPRLMGKNCEIDLEQCRHLPCQNKGTCINIARGGYRCECTPGYTGRNCTDDIDECQSTPCMNGGTCHNKEAYYECICIPKFTGRNCEIDMEECQRLRCRNRGTCRSTERGFKCDCTPGYRGEGCDEGDMLKHIRLLTYFKQFRCSENWYSVYEELTQIITLSPYVKLVLLLCCSDVDECLTIPCINGGECINSYGSYVCVCFSEFTGPHCEYATSPEKEFEFELTYAILGKVCLAILIIGTIIVSFIALLQYYHERKKEQESPYSMDYTWRPSHREDLHKTQLAKSLREGHLHSVSLESSGSQDHDID
ncbi:hypothetical protein M514_12872 [Trichuris suis]|uniref:EGF-like domain-containing protein n=1 Tax=Trichuris suis TaxID=68888 RepID=A0A085NDI8_9BILA|nr:hypothetical protein M514_12872 [Trichuris suis]